MKIAAIGDPHGNLEKITKIPLDHVDLILLTGDLGKTDMLRRQALQYLNIPNPGPKEKRSHAEGFRQAFLTAHETALKLAGYLAGFCPVFIVRGNADLSNYDTRKFSRTFGIELPFLYQDLRAIRGVRLIDNQVADFGGLRIGGIKYFTDICWAEEFELAGIEKIRRRALQDTGKISGVLGRFGRVDILLTHVPPYAVLDRVDSASIPPTWIGRHAGSKTVLEYILREQPGYVFCGHIHESEGFEKVGSAAVYNLGMGGSKIVEL
ncbi:MAG: metallophosphoesterase [Chloroflexi bacterium]|nr:metallophosphoesterase [Chloroflexota bacterium]